MGATSSAGNFGTRSSPEFTPGGPTGLIGIGHLVAADHRRSRRRRRSRRLVGDAMGGRLLSLREHRRTGAPAFAGEVDPFCAADIGDRPSPDFIDLDEDGDLDVSCLRRRAHRLLPQRRLPAARRLRGAGDEPVLLPTSEGDDASLAFATSTERYRRCDDREPRRHVLVAFNQRAPGRRSSCRHFADASLGPPSATSSRPGLADVDADGDVDVLVAATTSPGHRGRPSSRT